VFSHSGLYLVLAKANKIVFLSVIISALSQYNLLNQKTMKKLVYPFDPFMLTAAFAQEDGFGGVRKNAISFNLGLSRHRDNL
jgi:hypothetical protein